MTVATLSRRLVAAKPTASLLGNLHALAILVRACAVGSGAAMVCAVGNDVHVLSQRRPLWKHVEHKAPETIVGVYDQRADTRNILADLQAAAQEVRDAA